MFKKKKTEEIVPIISSIYVRDSQGKTHEHTYEYLPRKYIIDGLDWRINSDGSLSIIRSFSSLDFSGAYNRYTYAFGTWLAVSNEEIK